MKKVRSIIIMAQFSGIDNSMGFKRGVIYSLTVYINGPTNYDITIRETHNKNYVPYSNILTFLENWTNIKTVNQ